jgi:hypothetical protein
MISLKSMERGYCCLTELESKGLFSTCSEFIMYVGESISRLWKMGILGLCGTCSVGFFCLTLVTKVITWSIRTSLVNSLGVLCAILTPMPCVSCMSFNILYHLITSLWFSQFSNWFNPLFSFSRIIFQWTERKDFLRFIVLCVVMNLE